MRKKFKVLDESFQIWAMDIEDRRNNIDNTVWATTRSGLDDISFNGICVGIRKVSVSEFLRLNKFGYSKMKEKLAEMGIIECK